MKGKSNERSRRRLIVALGVLLAIAVGTATLLICQAIAYRPVTVRLIGPFEDPRWAQAFRAELKQFALREKNVTVHMSPASLADIEGRTASDAADWEIAIGSSRLADGRPGVAAPARPLYGTLWLLYYNKAVLAKAGILPAAGAPGISGALASGAASLGNLRDAFAAVAKAGAVPIALGSAYGWPLAVWIEALMAADGSTAEAGRLIASDFDLASPALAKAIAEFKAFEASGAVDLAHASKDWPQSLRDLIGGKAGFCLINEELVASLPPLERARIGYLPLPGSAGSADSATKGWVIGSLYYIAQRAGQKGRTQREARALVEWLTSEGASERLSSRLDLPFFAGGRGPYLALPSVTSIPNGAVVRKIQADVLGAAR